MPKGDWIRWNKKTVIEEVHRLDIRLLSLQNHDGSTITWGDGITLRVRYETDTVVLVENQQAITLSRSQCQYGGYRQWFLCPACTKRVAVLYEVQQSFKCRHCHHLPYMSQREGKIERLQRKARKIRRRLNAIGDLSVPVRAKPKGMHWKTFNHLVREEERVNSKAVVAMGKLFGIIV